MILRALILVLVAACGGGKTGKLMADTPILPYIAPDADELAGIEPKDEDEQPDGTEPAPAPPPKKP
jgi:hypothetical protein